jgi:hypothetical protein
MRGHQKHVNEEYLAYIRELDCVRCEASAPSDPHHIVSRGWREPTRNDWLSIPLCRPCHNLLESPGMDLKRWLDGMKLSEVWLAEKVCELLVRFFRGSDDRERAF